MGLLDNIISIRFITILQTSTPLRAKNVWQI